MVEFVFDTGDAQMDATMAALAGTSGSAYKARPISRRRRRTAADMQEIRDGIYNLLADDHPQTGRQVYYRLVGTALIEKTEGEYKNTVIRLLGEMRRDGSIPYGWLADSTRYMRRPETYSSLEAALARTAETYRRGLWEDAAVQVEVWSEKETLAGVLDDVTFPADVPLMICRGYPSMSFTHSAAEAIGARGARRQQRTVIYYFGDHDPSGTDIDRVVVKNIGESLLAMYDWTELGITDPEVAFYHYADFERVAVTVDQIETLRLPTRPTKKTDGRSKNFKGESVEVDAIPADLLRQIATEAIERHVDKAQLAVLQNAEEEERKALESIDINNLPEAT